MFPARAVRAASQVRCQRGSGGALPMRGKLGVAAGRWGAGGCAAEGSARAGRSEALVARRRKSRRVEEEGMVGNQCRRWVDKQTMRPGTTVEEERVVVYRQTLERKAFAETYGRLADRSVDPPLLLRLWVVDSLRFLLPSWRRGLLRQ